MKIIQIIPHYPPNIGGVQNCARELSERLARRGHQLEIFTSSIGCKKGKLKSTRNLKIHYLKSLEIAHTPIIPSLLFRLLRIPKNSVIHLHVTQAFLPEVVFLVSKMRKIPYLVHFHTDVGPSGKLGFLLPWYKKYCLKKVLKSAKKIIVLTPEYKEIVKRKYNLLEKITIIPNGVGEEFFLNKEKFSAKNTNLIFVGRLSVEKNVPRLIEAAALVKNKIAFHIVGDGEMKQKIKELIAKKKLKNVILHGRKTGKELINLYRLADIFLLASDYEGLPLVLLEAMASGIPIVASEARGVSKFAGKVGILVNPSTAQNFAKEIDNLIKDRKLRETLSKKGREKAKQYDWNKIAARFENVYREVINETNKK